MLLLLLLLIVNDCLVEEVQESDLYLYISEEIQCGCCTASVGIAATCAINRAAHCMKQRHGKGRVRAYTLST